jgi:drug/metabolite transporter (DMT)-like permease
VAPAQAVHLRADALAAVAVLGVLGTVLAYILNYRLITDDGPTVASTVTYLLPAVSVTLGILILGEPLTWHLITGTPTVLAGTALTARRTRQPKH